MSSLTRKTALITLTILCENVTTIPYVDGKEIKFDLVIENDATLHNFIIDCRNRGHVVIDWEVSFKSLDIINTFDNIVWDCLNKISNDYELNRFTELQKLSFISAPVTTKNPF